MKTSNAIYIISDIRFNAVFCVVWYYLEMCTQYKYLTYSVHETSKQCLPKFELSPDTMSSLYSNKLAPVFLRGRGNTWYMCDTFKLKEWSLHMYVNSLHMYINGPCICILTEMGPLHNLFWNFRINHII